MKFIVIGKQCSGKFEVLNKLSKMGVKVAHEFTTESKVRGYHDPNIQKYEFGDVNSIFETGAYVYIKTGNESIIGSDCSGMSQYDYDNSDAMVLTPDCISILNKSIIQKHKVVVIWMDNNRDQRIHRFVEEGRNYDFKNRDLWEVKFDKDIVDFACAHDHLYFFNEDPGRVACIIKALITNPELLNVFIKNFK